MTDAAPSTDREVTLLRFLMRVLPDQGIYAVGIFRPGAKAPRHFWTPSLLELARKLLEEDARGNTVYHACASHREQINRKQANALGAKAFWLDIDAGDGKPYRDPIEAYQQVELFCRIVGLPPPVYVGSENGLHVYWPLTVMLDRRNWERYARGLKQLCVTHGLYAGPERTADIASILRPPGTHHRKGKSKLVECGELTGPYEIERFEGLLQHSRTTAEAILQQTPYGNEAEEGRVHSALSYVSASGYDNWIRIGMALHSTGWASAFQIWDDWSRTVPEKYKDADLHKKWESFSRRDGDMVSLGTLFQMAKAGGWAEAEFHTDLGNARRLIARHGADIRFIPEWRNWIVWDGTRWRVDDDGAIMRLAKETVESMYAEALRLSGTQAKRIAKTRLEMPSCRAPRCHGEPC
jgi:hypothetical protein